MIIGPYGIGYKKAGTSGSGRRPEDANPLISGSSSTKKNNAGDADRLGLASSTEQRTAESRHLDAYREMHLLE